MIVFDLSCNNGHVFEGWFSSSDDFDQQHKSGLVSCPTCGSGAIVKAPMAPAVSKKGTLNSKHSSPNQERAPAGAPNVPLSNGPLPPQVRKAIAELAKAQAKALQDSTWVGRKFVEETRKIHYGESEGKAIHGQATRDEAAELLEEGIAIAPLPLPVAPPDELN